MSGWTQRDEQMERLILDGDWTVRIRVADVLRARTGQLRVVRHVTHSLITGSGGPPHIRTSVTFKINRCSWTRRCYTVYNSSDLRRLYRPTRGHIELRKKMDRAILQEIIRPAKEKPRLTCCDVESVPA